MFNIFKKKPIGTKITLKLSGLHCTSCSLNIDGELEETAGIVSSNTSYAKSESVIEYDSKIINIIKIKSIIKGIGYEVVS